MLSRDKATIDPEGKYQADGLRTVEQNALRVLALIQPDRIERTRDSIQIDCGGDKGVVLLVTAEAIELRLPTVEWTMGSHGDARTSRLWKRITASRLSDKRLRALIDQAIEARGQEFKVCRYCGKTIPAEYRHEDDLCMGCASRHEGIIY